MPSSSLKKQSWLGTRSGLTEAVPHQVKAVGVETWRYRLRRAYTQACLTKPSLQREGPERTASPANTLSLYRCTSPWMLSAVNSKNGASPGWLKQAL